MIHVCYGLYDKDGRYSKFTGTSMVSLFENVLPSVSVCIHILHDNTLTEDNRDKFSYIAGRYGQQIKFYNVEKIGANEILEIKSIFDKNPEFKKFTVGTLFRLLIPKIFPEEMEKIIYLDSDIIVNLDIDELWRVELGDKPVAAAPECEIEVVQHIELYLIRENFVDSRDYFNSGVMIFNINKLRSEHSVLNEGINFVVNNPQCGLFDQDILNYSFSKNYIKLPEYFNVFIKDERTRNPSLKIRKAIYHYIEDTLKFDMRDNFNRLWFSYFEKTPWFNKETLAHINEGIVQLHVSLKVFAARMTALMSGKERGFFVIAPSVDAIKKTFYVRDNEEIIPAVNQESLKQLVGSMKAAGGKKVYFIYVGAAYGGVRFELMKAGFVENRDFIDISNFLSELHGAPLDTYPFVKLL